MSDNVKIEKAGRKYSRVKHHTGREVIADLDSGVGAVVVDADGNEVRSETQAKALVREKRC